MALASTLVPQGFCPSSDVFVVEFLIADLAFAAKSITTMTITSPELLAEVLDNHPPSAIITDADFLSHIIEQIYDLNQHHHTTVIVVGDPGSVGTKLAKEMDLLKFSDIEKEGASTPVDLSPPTGEPCIESTPSDGIDRSSDVDHVFTIAFSKTPSGTGFPGRAVHPTKFDGRGSCHSVTCYPFLPRLPLWIPSYRLSR
jgi:hypothetical protein